jgi:hypothetical protein
MESIRIGNDINIEWTILRDGNPESLDGKDISVFMTNGYRKMVVKDLHIRDNVIQFTYLGKDQEHNGVYTLTLIENKGQEGMYTVDACDAFRIVPRSCVVDGGAGCGNIKVDTVRLTGDIKVPVAGSVSGTSDYNELSNKPSINGTTLKGNMSLEKLGIQPTGDYATRDEIPVLPDNIVIDPNYTHTDNNLTDILLEKLNGLGNYDDSTLREALTSEVSRAKEVEGNLDKAIKKVASDLSTFITGDPDADNIINRWQEVVAFLSGITEEKDLSGLLMDLRTQMTEDVATKLSGYYTSGQVDDKFVARVIGSRLMTEDEGRKIAGLDAALERKVDKVEGKGLSSNDLTNELLEKIKGLSNYDDSAIKSEITSIKSDIDTLLGEGGSDAIDTFHEIEDFLRGITDKQTLTGLLDDLKKEVTAIIPTKTSQLQNDDNTVKDASYIHTDNNFSNRDKTKLSGIEEGARVNVNSDWNAVDGDAFILNKPTIPTVDVSKEYVDTQLATKSDLPDYTVFDILVDTINSDSLSISQDDYNILLSKFIENQYMYTFPIRDNGLSVVSLAGLADSDGTITLIMQQETGIGSITSLQVGIKSDLTLSPLSSAVAFDSTNNTGIDISVNQGGVEDMKNKTISLHTTGDGTKSLMDDGKYRKLPVYGRNLLLGSGKEVSNSNYNIANYWLAEQIPNGTQVTLTVWGELGENKNYFEVFASDGITDQDADLKKTEFVNGRNSVTWNWKVGSSDNTMIRIYAAPGGSSATSTIHKIKLEYGDIATEWTPAWEDIPDIEERYAYGVEWDMASSSPDGKRVGNMQLHRELPVQSKIRGCVLDNSGGVKKYLGASSWSQEDMSIDYLLEAIMAEMDRFWIRFYIKGLKFGCMMSDTPMPGYTYINKRYMSAFEGGIDRPSMTLLSAYGVGSTNVNRRGGDNTSEWDNTYRSLLGCPVTNLTRDQFRQAARKRGSGWEMYTYNAHKTLFWLFAVEYATLDSQKPFNAQKDANGFAQGGLGPGPTQMTDWTNFNNANPLIPCGYTNEFGNGSGEKAYVVKNASGGTHATLMANRYRGIENPFGHIWKYTDGANIQVTTGDAGLSILWTTDDPSNFGDTSYTGYDKKGNICRTNGYAKKMLLGEDGDIVPTEVGGSSSTYWCDYYYTYTSANRMQVVLVGGNADDGSRAGLASVDAAYAPSGAYRNIGSRLCFFPEFRKTSA